MTRIEPSQRTAIAAYGAALLFAIHLVTYFIAPIRDVTTNSSVIGAEALALLAIAEHLILFPVIAALPAPKWARAAGYGWLVLHMSTGAQRRISRWAERRSFAALRMTVVLKFTPLG